MFDDTKRREILEDVPWIAEELTTVIEVAFDCVSGEPEPRIDQTGP